jgi:hypothetical protein
MRVTATGAAGQVGYKRGMGGFSVYGKFTLQALLPPARRTVIPHHTVTSFESCWLPIWSRCRVHQTPSPGRRVRHQYPPSSSSRLDLLSAQTALRSRSDHL